jgi:hypothetical protein
MHLLRSTLITRTELLLRVRARRQGSNSHPRDGSVLDPGARSCQAGDPSIESRG